MKTSVTSVLMIKSSVNKCVNPYKVLKNFTLSPLRVIFHPGDFLSGWFSTRVIFHPDIILPILKLVFLNAVFSCYVCEI